jgi:hypothetical protein
MSTIYRMASDEESLLVTTAMTRWHELLRDAQVKVGMVFAHNEDGGAVKHGGYNAAATIKPLSLKERVIKGYDAEMLIDEDHWDSMDERGRLALIDHELSHIQPVPKTDAEMKKDPSTPWKRDDIGRPKLRSRKGDWNAGDGFKCVVERHGENAIEFTNLRAAWKYAEKAAGVEVDDATDAARPFDLAKGFQKLRDLGVTVEVTETPEGGAA